MSKFNYEGFYGGYDCLAVSKEKYTKQEAIDIARKELAYEKQIYLAICDGFVKHRAGMNEDNEPCVGWWIEYEKTQRDCPAFLFHLTDNKDEHFKNYEYVLLHEGDKS